MTDIDDVGVSEAPRKATYGANGRGSSAININEGGSSSPIALAPPPTEVLE
eukprot:CAMPEP_0173437742 /NCGR_PEP_ID=MMETSP1357-20121228/18313_1 /TAXON_ID=77926 /ORGANISM="Hemiselmis rufescens, Strain PCC563" /LENGTH=50 /DNA_ID=CAMNT_0014402943 /DNA_START=1 /DNA_END=153 /DNA_ORIENTATION=-